MSGPSVCTTVHRDENLRGAPATLTRDDIEVEANDDFRDADVSTRSREDRQWGPWSLTQRELEVLQLLAEGATNGEISQRLYISPKTTKNHLAAIFQKLDVTNRTHALVRAVVMWLVTSNRNLTRGFARPSHWSIKPMECSDAITENVCGTPLGSGNR